LPFTQVVYHIKPSEFTEDETADKKED
jgi:hypothetical protein